MYGGPSPETTGPSPGPSPEGRGVVCEVTPIGLLVWGVGRFFSHKKHSYLSWWIFFPLTERTEFTEFFGARFEPTERLRHTENTERYS